MSNGITYCFDDQDVSEAAHLMEQKQSHRLAVLNRRTRMFGIGLHLHMTRRAKWSKQW